MIIDWIVQKAFGENTTAIAVTFKNVLQPSTPKYTTID